ncbi:MAG: FtsW/RodA/SpoVE family cell cycle protein [Oscillospiraceae bacterium]|nr:FtsW/RodA/SpoVE family cell cycle protein [Oscillospiraceae bacterium]
MGFAPTMMILSRAMLILLSLLVIGRCLRSLLRERYEPEIWAYLRLGQETFPVHHWENVLGRSRGADIRVQRRGVSRSHAVLRRDDRGIWTVYDLYSRGGVWVGQDKVGPNGLRVPDGGVIDLAGNKLRFRDTDCAKRERLEAARTSVGRRVSPVVTLLELSAFQLFLLLQHAISASAEDLPVIARSFVLLIVVEWSVFTAMRVIGRSGFEVETLAFYLTSLGFSVAASSTPGDMYKQILLTIAAIALFLLNGWWLRDLRRTEIMRIPIAIAAIGLLAVNVVFSEAVLGAKNWLEIGGFSFQPSELVKVAFVYVGAATLDRLYRKGELFSFIAFSAVCVVALALIGDFGTALIFFVTFLVVAFLRSGSIATVFLAVSGAAMAGILAVSVKPYIAQRFASWGHVWEDIYGPGYQQTRAMSAAASGGLFGKGAGAGWIKDVFAANTDMVFAMVCEELGLIVALCMVLAVLALAFFAVRSARHARSSYYSIAACAAMSLLLTQLALNVFGTVDILPFTGVTFPFVSRGGSSLLACWMLMAFIKGADNRRGASFAVRPGERMRGVTDEDADEEDEA